MKKTLAILALLCPLALFGQTAARYDLPALMTTPGNTPSGSLPALIAVKNATVSVCSYPATLVSGMCTNTITTYTGASEATACPSTAQLTMPGKTACVSQTDQQGSLGFWYDQAANAHVVYTVKTTWGTFGPYDISQPNATGLPLTGGTLTGPLAGTTASFSSTITAPLVDKAGQVFNAVGYGAVGNGTTDDSTAINAAGTAALAGGFTFIPPGHTYRIASGVAVSNSASGLGGNSIDFQGANLYVDINGGFGIATSTTTLGTGVWHNPISAITPGDTSSTVTVPSFNQTCSVATGMLPNAFLIYNPAPLNPGEYTQAVWARITSIVGSTVTIDSWVPPLDAAATGYLNCVTPWNNASIKGGTFTNNWTGGHTVQADVFIHGQFNTTIGALAGTDPGSGLYVDQYSQGVVHNGAVNCLSSQNFGVQSYGGCVLVGETFGEYIPEIFARDFANSALDIEGAPRGDYIGLLEVVDNNTSDTSGGFYISTIDGGHVDIGIVDASGLGHAGGSNHGILFISPNGAPGLVHIGTLIDRTEYGVGWTGGTNGTNSADGPRQTIIDNFRVENVPNWANAHVFGEFTTPETKSVQCVVDLTNTSTQTCLLPSGLDRSIVIQSQKGAAVYNVSFGAYISAGGVNSQQFESSLVANQPVDISAVSGCTGWGGDNHCSEASLNKTLVMQPAAGQTGTDILTVTVNFWPGTTWTGNLTTTSGSTTATVTSTTGIYPGMLISAANVPFWTRVASVDTATQITLGYKAIATATDAASMNGGGDDASGSINTTNQTAINNAAVPKSLACAGTNSSGQFVSASCPTKYTQAWTPGAATVSTCTEQTLAVTGLLTTQAVAVTPPASLGTHIWIGSARVSAANTLSVSFCADATGGTPPSGNYIVLAQ